MMDFNIQATVGITSNIVKLHYCQFEFFLLTSLKSSYVNVEVINFYGKLEIRVGLVTTKKYFLWYPKIYVDNNIAIRKEINK